MAPGIEWGCGAHNCVHQQVNMQITFNIPSAWKHGGIPCAWYWGKSYNVKSCVTCLPKWHENEQNENFRHWIKIRTSYFAGDHSPIIISWQDSYFSAWTWECLIVHQQHRGREMESVWPALNMLSHLGLHPDANRATWHWFVSVAETIGNMSNFQARSAEQQLPTELFVKW